MAVATPLTKFSASPVIPVAAAMILMPSLAIFLGAGNSAPGHKPKQMKLVAVTYGEDTHTSFIAGTEPVSLVQQQAEQNAYAVAQGCEQQLWPDFGAYNDTYDGLSSFGGGDDIVRSLFSNLVELAWHYRIRLLFVSANLLGCVFLAREIAGARARRRK